jgi:hypothetical protein
MKQVIIKSVTDVGVYFGKQPRYPKTDLEKIKEFMEELNKTEEITPEVEPVVDADGWPTTGVQVAEAQGEKPPAQTVSVTEFIKVPVEPGLLISGDGDDAGANRAVLPVNPSFPQNPLQAVRFAAGAGQWRKPKK